jgi:hypothetical protein
MMAAGKYQRGASIWIILLMVIVFGFATIFALKLIPIYIESYKIDQAMEGALKGDVANQSVEDIKAALLRRLDIDDVRRIWEANWREYVTITKTGGVVTLQVTYDAEEQLMGNLYIVARFDKVKTN